MNAIRRSVCLRAAYAAVLLGGCALSYYLGALRAREPAHQAGPTCLGGHVPAYLLDPPADDTLLLPLFLHRMHRSAGDRGSPDLYIHLLFVNASHLDGEFDLPVSLLLGICEDDPKGFFRAAATRVSPELYHAWLARIPSACLTDFPGDRDLQSMEERRVRIYTRLRETDLADAHQDAMKAQLITLLEKTEVRRVE